VAQRDVAGHDVADGRLLGKAAAVTNRETDIPVGDHSDDPSLPYDRQRTAVVFAHPARGRGQTHLFRARRNRAAHHFTHFHTPLLGFGETLPAERRRRLIQTDYARQSLRGAADLFATASELRGVAGALASVRLLS
jgi:hypothetical protein